jgi:hypothetical protein
MKKPLLLAAAALVVLAAAAALVWGAKEAQAPTLTHHLNADAYPLYGALTWGGEQATSSFGMQGYRVISQPVSNINDIASVTQPFSDYYAQKLAALGWTVDSALAAGGPGADLTAYQKGSDYILVNYQTDFKGTPPNAPVQCPCDVTFSVFSGSQ